MNEQTETPYDEVLRLVDWSQAPEWANYWRAAKCSAGTEYAKWVGSDNVTMSQAPMFGVRIVVSPPEHIRYCGVLRP